jgi:hypothetical protein
MSGIMALEDESGPEERSSFVVASVVVKRNHRIVLIRRNST